MLPPPLFYKFINLQIRLLQKLTILLFLPFSVIFHFQSRNAKKQILLNFLPFELFLISLYS